MDEKTFTASLAAQPPAGQQPAPADDTGARGHARAVARPDHKAEMRHRASVRGMLRDSGLRPTRQRMALGEILFARGHRHISAERLHEEAVNARVPVSLATVYNTLHQFTEAGLLREVAIDGTKTWFDTNVGDHHHFFIEGDNALVDIPGTGVGIASIPEAPDGMEIVRVDVVVRVRPRRD